MAGENDMVELVNLAIGVIMVLGGEPFLPALFQTELCSEDESNITFIGISQFFGTTSLCASAFPSSATLEAISI